MVKIRLRRVGAKKQPSYRVVVADSRSPRGGRFIETIGFYNPRTEPLTVEIKEDRALYWLSQGAQPTEAVAGLFNRLGTMDRLARLREGEALDVLLSEAAAAHQQLAEKAPTPKARVETQQAAEVAEVEVAGVEQETQGVAVADLEVNAEGTEDVANAEETIQPTEEEA
jgi:small subunit ribosomal protein S16